MSAPKFERGSSLSIFVSDRREDMIAMIFAFAIAFGVMLTV